jgi:hypothetical protein
MMRKLGTWNPSEDERGNIELFSTVEERESERNSIPSESGGPFIPFTARAR